jgi:glyoxylase-like metal-dependent hydrolase (beta-lactamase superfamily II)
MGFTACREGNARSEHGANNGDVIQPIAGVRGAQAYWWQTPDGSAVIDPGYTGSVRAVLRFLEKQAQVARSLDWVIITHHHIDHAGTALALCQATGARLAVHRADAPYLRARRPRERMTFWGAVDWLPQQVARYIVSCADCDIRFLEDGDTVAGLTVIHAPGHTPGSICLWSADESALFTGDVLNNEHARIGTPPWTVNHSHRLARHAPEKLHGLRYEQAYFGHGPAILQGADQAIAGFVDSRFAPSVPGSSSPKSGANVGAQSAR